MHNALRFIRRQCNLQQFYPYPAWIFVPQCVDTGGGQRQLLASDALYFAHPGVGNEFGYGEKFVAGLFDLVFHPQPVEQGALGLLLTGRDLDQAPDETGQGVGQRIFTSDRANLWMTRFCDPP